MRIDIRHYEVMKKPILSAFKGQYEGRVRRGISELSVLTPCPCIVTAYWIGEALGWPIEVRQAIETYKEAYGYTEIEGKPEGTPEGL
jgi:hypothetical protein